MLTMQAARTIDDPLDLFQMMPVPPGRFQMGSTAADCERVVEDWCGRLLDSRYTKEQFGRWIRKEYPARLVEVDAFRLARFPVTNRQFRQFISRGRQEWLTPLVDGRPDNHPVWRMDRPIIDAFLGWLCQETGLAFRLPTETEWEYAARGTDGREFPFGDEFDSRLCNTYEAGLHTTTPVNRYAAHPSAFGLCDMAGNVEEWTASHYQPYPGGISVEDHLTELFGASYPILRGGSAERGGDLARCARRHGPYPRFSYYGFRLALDA